MRGWYRKKSCLNRQLTVPDFTEREVGVGLGEAGGGASEVVVINGAENGVGGALVRGPKKLGEEAAQHCEITADQTSLYAIKNDAGAA